MTWGHASDAGNRARGAFRSLARFLSASDGDTDGPAQITAPKSRTNGARHFDLTARAMSLHNRNRAAAKRYLETHDRLRREVYSDAG
jgi:hypothetical protein